jgi:threonine dehydratase
MAALYREDRLVVEGGGAVGVAAVLSGKIEPTPGMVVVVSGGNVDEEVLREVLQR